jgi:serine/threonine protein kinase/predicted Zn-dependent protease
MKCPKCQADNPENTKFCGECGTQLKTSELYSLPTKTIETSREELTTGSVFASRYQIIEELGSGGMGKVYKALDSEVNEKIAIKLIRPEIAKDKKIIERFRNELKFARKIRHKNVCQMYDLSREGDRNYITMEYVRGDDLKSLIKRMGSFSPAQAISTITQVCDGLIEAHKLGVVHRDLKPQNIMIDQDGNARIMDFGIARSLEGKGLTGMGVMIGTPEYMSPEQVEGKETDQRSDIYSLGVILFEMVTGQTPFQGDTPFTIGVKHKSEMPPNPKKLNSQISDELNQVILRCLEKEKENRYQSAGEMRSDLKNIEEGLPTAEKIVPTKTLTSREFTVRFNLKKLYIPAAIGLAVVIAAVIFWNQILHKEAAPPPLSDKPSVAVMYFKNNTGDESLDHWRTMLPNLLTADLTQSKYIRVLSEGQIFDILSRLNQTQAQTYSSESLRQVAAQGRVNHILQGAFARAGDEFRINVILQNADTLEHIGSETISGKGEQSIFSMVDELTRRIKSHFALTPEQIGIDIDKEIGQVTTGSPGAYRHFVQGIMHDRKAEYRKAIECMEKAVAIDPEFASAYHVMSWCYGNLGYGTEEKQYIQKAMDLSDRLSDREKYSIQGTYYIDSEKTYDQALKALKKLVSLYPDDISGNNLLGVLHVRLGEREKAIEYYGNAIKAGTEDVVLYTNQAAQYSALGKFDRALEVCANYIEKFEDSAAIRREMAYIYRSKGDYTQALVQADKALSLSGDYWRNLRTNGDIYLYMDEWDKAEKEYRKLSEKQGSDAYGWGLARKQSLCLIKGQFGNLRESIQEGLELAKKISQPFWVMNWHTMLSYGESQLGRFDKALEELDLAWQIAEEEEYLSSQRRILRDRALVYLKMNSMEEAQKTATRLKQMIDQAPVKASIHLYHYLAGMMELEKKNLKKAVELIKKARSLLGATSALNLVYTHSLGQAHYLAGDLEKAVQEFEKAAAINTGKLSYGDVYVRSYFMLGQVYQKMGQPAKGIKNYKKFLEFWKDADPCSAEVQESRTQLQKLQPLLDSGL